MKGAALLLCVPTFLWGSHALAQNAYLQRNLVASNASYGAQYVEPALINPWGIAIRPAGLGGHFWFTTQGTGLSIEYVGDVGNTPLYQDDLRYVTVPGPTMPNPALPSQPFVTPGTPTGVVFNGSDNFSITQGSITNAARFIFVTDQGTLSAWTERKNADGSFDRPGFAKLMIDRSDQGSQFFGVGLNPAQDRLYVADFGAQPTLRTYDASFSEISNGGFANPFATGPNAAPAPGDYVPFNVQSLGDRVFVAYAKSQDDPNQAGTQFFAGEEDAAAGHGRIAEFSADGALVRVWDDQGSLNAPWGVAIAPSDFGNFSGHLLVGNFGDGSIAAFDPTTHRFVDYLRDANGEILLNEGLWGLQFGNGASLGESNRLYFAAGPLDETEGLIGSLQAVPEPGTYAMFFVGLAGLALARRIARPRA